MFIQVAQLARVGVGELGTMALDGTKVKAHASKHKAMSYGRMKEREQKLKQEIEALLEAPAQSMPKRMRVWAWIKQMTSCLWSFEDGRSGRRVEAAKVRLEARQAEAE